MKYLLDTNVVSEWAKPRPDPAVVRWLADVDEDRVFVSVLTLAELARGVHLLPAGKKRERLQAWLSVDVVDRFEGRILDVTPAVALRWGQICAASEGRGRTLGVVDGFLAASALAHGLVFVTRNTKDFEGLGIELMNPWAEPYP